MMHFQAKRQPAALLAANQEYLASRETAELRAESLQMGNSLLRLLYGLPQAKAVLASLPGLVVERSSLPLAWTLACASWEIGASAGLHAYAWSWAENQVAAAIKAVPLGQQAGQRLFQSLQAPLLQACDFSQQDEGLLPEDQWSNFAPGFAIASSQHESQYSRIFRS
jgi:urease accessory protein